MATGACGINCDVCRLRITGTCSTCGSGTGREGGLKLEAQVRILGQPCPVLDCARLNRLAYCMRDCPQFPCENFRNGPYPFSGGFLQMQQRRRSQPPPSFSPKGGPIIVPEQYWERLSCGDAERMCAFSLATMADRKKMRLKSLHRQVVVDIPDRSLWEGGFRIHDPLLELLILVYLLNAGPGPVRNELIGVSDLKDSHFFKGPHALKTAPVLERFGADLQGFKRAAESIGGNSVEMADAAFRFSPLPKIPVYYLLWEADETFAPNLSILFDRSIEDHFPADAVWGVVNFISDCLLRTW